jgi:hypothetical protein
MEQDLIDTEERKIYNDRSANFRGTACVRLEALDFDVPDAREENKYNVQTLTDIFQTDNCFSISPEHRISATVDQKCLENAVQLSPAKTSLATLLKNPRGIPPDLIFPPNYRLKCLQGRSRVEAAKQVLPPEKRFWGVDLYLEGNFPYRRSPVPFLISETSRYEP